jgi:hypothetical protein
MPQSTAALSGITASGFVKVWYRGNQLTSAAQGVIREIEGPMEQWL